MKLIAIVTARIQGDYYSHVEVYTYPFEYSSVEDIELVYLQARTEYIKQINNYHILNKQYNEHYSKNINNNATLTVLHTRLKQLMKVYNKFCSATDRDKRDDIWNGQRDIMKVDITAIQDRIDIIHNEVAVDCPKLPKSCFQLGKYSIDFDRDVKFCTLEEWFENNK